MTAHAIDLDEFETPPGAGMETRQYITFSCAGQIFGVDIMSMREIRNWSPVTPLPAQKPDVLGIIEIRGRVIPVHDLALRIGCSVERRTGREGQVILVLFINGRDMGLLVDSVCDIIEISAEDMLPVPQIEGSAARFLAGIARQGDDLVAILDQETVRAHAVDFASDKDEPVDAKTPASDADAEFVFVDEL